MEEGIAGSDVGQEGVAQALTLGRALDEAGDVHHVQEGRDFAEIENKCHQGIKPSVKSACLI